MFCKRKVNKYGNCSKNILYSDEIFTLYGEVNNRNLFMIVSMFEIIENHTGSQYMGRSKQKYMQWDFF